MLLSKQLYKLFWRASNLLGQASGWLTSSTPKRKANCRWRFWSTHCPKSKRSVSLNFSPWKVGILSWIPSNNSSARTARNRKCLTNLHTSRKCQVQSCRGPHVCAQCQGLFSAGRHLPSLSSSYVLVKFQPPRLHSSKTTDESFQSTTSIFFSFK